MPMDKPISIPTRVELLDDIEDKKLERELVEKGVVPFGYVTDHDELLDTGKTRELVPLVESPAVNRLLLRNARKSLNEIAAATGLDVREVEERISALLDNRSWRDDLQEEKLLLAEIGMMIEDIRERATRSNLDDEAWASMMRVQLAAIKTLLEQLDKRQARIDGKLAIVTKAEAEFMAAAIQLAMERAVFNIEKKYPHIEPELIRYEFEQALPEAIQFLESKASDD